MLTHTPRHTESHDIHDVVFIVEFENCNVSHFISLFLHAWISILQTWFFPTRAGLEVMTVLSFLRDFAHDDLLLNLRELRWLRLPVGADGEVIFFREILEGSFDLSTINEVFHGFPVTFFLAVNLSHDKMDPHTQTHH